jgi:branched-subunit amino acid ABC-type transport system permease component
VAQNRNAAEIMGINATLIIVLSMALTSALAGVAGLLVGFSYGLVSPFLGLTYSIKGLIAMIIGGVGSVTGAALGALVIGLTEALTVAVWGSQLRDLSVFLVLLAVLLIRPSGLLPAAARG